MPSAENLKYACVRARQSDDHQVLSFAAKAADILRFASIERIGRGTQGDWKFDEETRRWNSLQNINREVALLKHYLVRLVKTDIRKNRKPAPAPLLDAMEQ